jgi:Xaa-Pro dipeptidase
MTEWIQIRFCVICMQMAKVNDSDPVAQAPLIERLTHAGAPQELSFPIEEYDARLAAVRARMANEGIEVLLLSSAPNQCYLTGYETIMPTCYAVAIVPAEGACAFHLPEEDVPSVALTGWVRDVAVFDWAQPLDVAEQLAEALRERGHHDKTIGVEMSASETYAYGAMDAFTYLRLTELLPDARFSDATNLVQEVRLRKSPLELDYMRLAGELTLIGIEASIAEVAPGRTDNDLAAAGYSAMVRAGSELMSVDPIVLAGRRGAWSAPHGTHKRVELRADDAVQLEYSGNYHRYNAPLIRTATVGPPSPGVRRLFDACERTVELLLAGIRAGRTGHDVAMEARRGFDDADPATQFHGGYGYAVGLAFPPTWTEAPVYVAEGIDRELECDMTLHLPIWSWLPGEFAVGVSETVRVTADGCELITPTSDRGLVAC